MAQGRKVAAILVADVVGYSRLGEADEERTLARPRTLRSDLIDPAIAVHNGRLVKHQRLAVRACSDFIGDLLGLEWRLTRRGEAFRAHVVSYADDFVILSRGPTATLRWNSAAYIPIRTEVGLKLRKADGAIRLVAQVERRFTVEYHLGVKAIEHRQWPILRAEQ